ncbi:histone acetyltransferase YNG2 [Sugiyamaella lignohabitans]|uniref:Chromatin modification-related protein n=1 Tax=Sugiyamaella lignohabitans TaxID=796027 RepID=A0A167F864_9ASCO|nr:histone acetyltransferase YNG2 [Sugiyamaella lignohabitans]ANB14939.1 histone acetyltransferase YNG2 [Sugiyamaella lignohabitans]
MKFYETRKRIQQRDNQIHKFIRANGSLADNPKEAAAYPKIRADFEKAMGIQQAKCDLANTGLYIISKQVKKLNDDIKKLEEEGLLAPASPSASNGLYSSYNTDSAPSTRQGSVPAGRESTHGPGATSGRSGALASSRMASSTAITAGISGSDRKRGSPAPGASRSSTPMASARPSKRQRLAMVAMDDDLSTAASSPNGVSVKHTSNRPLGASSAAVMNSANGLGVPMSGGVGSHNGGLTSAVREEEEVLYCTCQQVSFGNMVACDNPDCQYEWFHYDCVGLKEPPSGTWYCPTCTKERKEARDAGPDFKDTSSNKRRK